MKFQLLIQQTRNQSNKLLNNVTIFSHTKSSASKIDPTLSKHLLNNSLEFSESDVAKEADIFPCSRPHTGEVGPEAEHTRKAKFLARSPSTTLMKIELREERPEDAGRPG